MTGNMKLMAGLFAAGLVIVQSCSWTDDDNKELIASLLGGCLAGVAIAIIMTILASLPLCCGVMKAQGKFIATLAILLGLLCCITPAITGFAVGANVVDKSCDRCAAVGQGSCSESDKASMQAFVGIGGLMTAYVYGFGWAALILGVAAASLGCCICCKCCKMKDEVGAAGGQPAVIGQPA